MNTPLHVLWIYTFTYTFTCTHTRYYILYHRRLHLAPPDNGTQPLQTEPAHMFNILGMFVPYLDYAIICITIDKCTISYRRLIIY
uniref:Uncharacterized protein n=1 Tax=Arundo donax TaxID=35708 RepID=A0A0A9HBX2_ARUDO